MSESEANKLTKEQTLQRLRTLSPKAKSAVLNKMLQERKQSDQPLPSQENQTPTFPD